jgi:hypothetical protein
MTPTRKLAALCSPSASGARQHRSHNPGDGRLAADQGIALVSVIMLVAFLIILGVFGTRSAQLETRIAGNDLRAQKALAVAEAGLGHGFALLKTSPGFDDELSGGGTGGALAALGSVTAIKGTQYRFRPYGGDDGYYVRVVDNYDETSGANNAATDNDGTVKIISRGQVQGAQRIVEATVGSGSRFPDALFGKQYVNLVGNSSIDSFDSRNGPYDAATRGSNGDTRSNGAITLSGSSMIYGGAMSVTAINADAGAVTGAQVVPAPPLNLPSVPACGPPYYPSTVGITTTGNASYNPATGELRAMSGSITLAAGTYCFQSINLSGNSTLSVSGPVSVFLTHASDIGGGGVLNPSGIAANFLLYSSCADSGDGLQLQGGASAYVAVYAPDTCMKFAGGPDLYGAVVAGCFSNVGAATIHYDESLRRLPLGEMRLSHWHEVRGG